MLSGAGRYNHFGLRKVWLAYYFDMGEDFWTSDKLGNRQFQSFRCWLNDAEIAVSGKITETGEEIRRLGADDYRVWAIIWTNLAFNAEIADTFVRKTAFDKEYTRSDLLSNIDPRYALASKQNIVSSLIETFKHSPIGVDLGNGVCRFKGRNVESIIRPGWSSVDEMCVVYAICKYAEHSGEKSIDISDLCNTISKNVTPQQLFGIKDFAISNAVSILAESYPDIISVTGSNIRFVSNHRAIDILKMIS